MAEHRENPYGEKTEPQRGSNEQPVDGNPYAGLTLPPNPYGTPPQYEYGPMPYDREPFAPVPGESDPYGYRASNPYSSGSPLYPPSTLPSQHGSPNGGYPAWAGPPPPRPRRSSAPWIVGAVAVVLLFAGGMAGISMGSAAHAPELQVQAYLDALVAADAEEALALTGTDAGPDDPLLANEAYRNADDRIARYTIRDSTVTGDSASVRATLTQGGASYDHEFSLTRTGREALFFDVWALEAPAGSVVSIEVSAPEDAIIEVGGVAVTAQRNEGVVELRALPGTYAVTLAGNTTWYDAPATSASVIGFGARAEPAEQLVVELTDEGTRAATDAVDAWLDECSASPDLAPAGCPFSAINPGDYELSNLVWTVTRPVFRIGSFSDGRWPVLTESAGEALATADALDRSTGRTGPIATDPFAFDIGGVIEEFTDAGATFVPAG